MSTPRISVVIPTRGRELRLAFALEALAEQTIRSGEFEVIVVRDADAQPPFAAAPAGSGLRLTELHLDRNAGPAPKRNAGWRAAEGELVAFTDDDCRPAADWLEQLLGCAAGSPGLVQGATAPDPAERHLLWGAARSVEIEPPSGWYETCNIAYPREMLERLGGFDERFPFLGDDTDLGCRAIAAGATAIACPAARVCHAVEQPHPLEAIRARLRRGSAAQVVARHPGLRRHLIGGLFTSRDHPALLLLASGLVLAPRRPLLATVLALPYLRRSVDRRRLTPWGLLRLLMQLLTKLSLDLASILGGLRSSATHRSPVL